ncbi:MAG: DUF4838 domain-containing protein, partial [Planctomycetes bacterium]|nr:DUF4838 domain-containing protein [Planctomycetota bacterium]
MPHMLMILLAACTAAGTDNAVLVENGRARSVIVVPDQATPTVRHAAEELQRYFKRMTSVEVPVVTESKISPLQRGSAPVRIDVGLTGRAKQWLPTDLTSNEERVVVRSGPGGIFVCGGGDRGTLFAVYRFLETLGCRWLTPEPQNEFVPERKTLAVGRLAIDTQPAFRWRLFIGGTGQREAWGLKMGFNGLYRPETAEQNGDCLYWPSAVPGVHAYCRIIPPDRYFKTHPEWFPLINGRRVPSSLLTNQLCVTAPGLADEFAKNVCRIFDKDQRCRLISISPNDGYGWCQCPKCRELDQRLCGARTT